VGCCCGTFILQSAVIKTEQNRLYKGHKNNCTACRTTQLHTLTALEAIFDSGVCVQGFCYAASLQVVHWQHVCHFVPALHALVKPVYQNLHDNIGTVLQLYGCVHCPRISHRISCKYDGQLVNMIYWLSLSWARPAKT